MTRESDFIRIVASRNVVRPRVVGIVIRDGHLLTQRPTDDPNACFALIGGEYEIGDTFQSRLRAEVEEETTAHLLEAEYLFVVENRFLYRGQLVHGVEHYLLAEIDRWELESREPDLGFQWIPLERLPDYDLRPHVVRDAIASGEYLSVKHLEVPFDDSSRRRQT